MKYRVLLLLAILVILMPSCSSNETKKGKIDLAHKEPIAFPETKSDKIFKNLRPETQSFNIKSDTDNLINCKNGTIIFIPKQSFIDSNGQVITGKVEVKVIEVLSVGDFIKANLQTISNGQVLQSDGMIYIDAKANNRPVTLADDKKLQIELPKINGSNEPADNKIFSGSYDSAGHINWTRTEELDNKLIPLPLELFDYTYYKSEDIVDPTDSGYTYPGEGIMIKDSLTFNKQNLNNTFIATREFEERFPYIYGSQWWVGFCAAFHNRKIKKSKVIVDSTISNFYLNNLNKPLWYCDSLAYAYLKTWSHLPNLVNWEFITDTKEDEINVFKKFYEQKLTTVIKFPSGLNLDSKDLREQLKAKGYKQDEINKMIGDYAIQKQLIASRKDKINTFRIVSNSFSIANLGWTNCDHFFNDSNARPSDIVASITPKNAYDACSISLVINGRKIAVNGMQNTDGTFRFTANDQMHMRLPIGEKATIVGISFKNNTPYLGTKEIIISEKANYDINFEASSLDSISNKLKSLN